LTSVI